MALIFYEYPAEGQTAIPYPNLALDTFDTPQKYVPFLGAGASLGGLREELAELNQPDQTDIDKACDAVGLKNDKSRRFLAMAIRIAWQMQAGITPASAQELYKKAKDSGYPPSSSELAEVFAALASYDRFDRPARALARRAPDIKIEPEDVKRACFIVAKLTGVIDTAPSLLSAASYFNYTQEKGSLWDRLREILANKEKPTKTHRLVACAAWHYLNSKPATDYLIVTTNFDRLIEITLDKAGVPYCVLTVEKNDGKVDAKFSESIQKFANLDSEKFWEVQQEHMRAKDPKNFQFTIKFPPIVILYKMHGCVFPPVPGRDSIILSDEDYVTFLRRNSYGNEMIPAPVKTLMDRKAFMFLGYSFGDWNVRGFYKWLVEDFKRNQKVPDCAVINSVDPYESGFFHSKQDIRIYFTTLETFAARMRENGPRQVASCQAWE